jgi:hypothetical protein
MLTHLVGPLDFSIRSTRMTLRTPCPYAIIWVDAMGNKRPRVNTADLNVRLPPELKEAARKAAKLDQRTLSGLVLKLLTDHCESVGTLKKTRRP